MDIYSIWAKAENGSLDKAKEIINEIAEKEKSTSFNPHVTLVTSMYSQAKAEKIFEKIIKNYLRLKKLHLYTIFHMRIWQKLCKNYVS